MLALDGRAQTGKLLVSKTRAAFHAREWHDIQSDGSTWLPSDFAAAEMPPFGAVGVGARRSEGGVFLACTLLVDGT